MSKEKKTNNLFDDIFGEIGRMLGEKLDEKLGTGGKKTSKYSDTGKCLCP